MVVTVVAVGVVASACNRSGSAETTVTTRPLITTTAPSETTTTTTTTLPPLIGAQGVEYRIVRRIPVSDLGDAVVVLVEGDSQSLTDIDLYDVITDVVETFPPIYEVYVVDDPAAVDIVMADEPSDEEQAILSEHFLARLVEGFRIVYEGPFGDVGTAVIGS